MKKNFRVFGAGLLTGFLIGQVARTLVIGIAIVALVIAAVWFAGSFSTYRDKLTNLFKR